MEKRPAVPELLCVVSGLYILSVLTKYLAFQCLWYTLSLCVDYIIPQALFVVYNLSDNFWNVNFLHPKCVLESSYQCLPVC